MGRNGETRASDADTWAGAADDDHALVLRAQANPARFGEIYERYAQSIYRYVYRRTGDPTVAEDLTIEAFERAFRAIGRFEWRGAPLVTWLLRIADRVSADWWRTQSRRREQSPSAYSAAFAASAEEEAVRREDDGRLYAALDSLAPARRQVVLLHLGEGLQLAQIAKRWGRGESAVRMLYMRALRDIREQLSDG